MFEKLGIAADVKPKIILANGSTAATESVAAGKATMVLTLFSEIVPTQGVDILGSFPGNTRSTSASWRPHEREVKAGRRRQNPDRVSRRTQGHCRAESQGHRPSSRGSVTHAIAASQRSSDRY